MSSSPSYQQQPKNALALNVARSWLRAVGATVHDSSQSGCDLSVEVRGGGRLEVAVVADLDGNLPDGEVLILLADELGSYDKDTALDAFHIITELAGYGRPMPVDRGVAPTKAEVYGKDIFLTASRHREFRAAPNLTKVKADEYKPIVLRACRNFFWRNTKLCLAHGYQVEDLSTFAWVWTHNFVHRYEIAHPTHKDGDDNQRLLTKYLKNRFGELYDLMLRQGKRVLVEADVAQIALLGRVLDSNEVIQKAPIEPEDIDSKPTKRRKTPRGPSIARRKKAASEVLKANLAALPHDVMVSRLTECAESLVRDYVTRREARRQLLMHFNSCALCQEKGLSLRPLSGATQGEEIGVRRDEDSAGVDTSSVEEGGEDPLG